MYDLFDYCYYNYAHIFVYGSIIYINGFYRLYLRIKQTQPHNGRWSQLLVKREEFYVTIQALDLGVIGFSIFCFVYIEISGKRILTKLNICMLDFFLMRFLCIPNQVSSAQIVHGKC